MDHDEKEHETERVCRSVVPSSACASTGRLRGHAEALSRVSAEVGTRKLIGLNASINCYGRAEIQGGLAARVHRRMAICAAAFKAFRAQGTVETGTGRVGPANAI